MWWFFACLFCVSFAYHVLDQKIDYDSFVTYLENGGLLKIILFFVLMIGANHSFNKAINYVQNDAIEHYINGDYEVIEKTVDGEIVDISYKIIPTDYN